MSVRSTALFFFLVLFVGLSSAAFAAERVGQILRIKGSCEVVTEGQRRPLQTATPVHLLDVVTTGAGARLVVELDDGTVLTLGENTELKIDEFVFRKPDVSDRLKLFVGGAFRFTTGQLVKTADSVIEINTRVPTLGVRGTDFWGGPLDGNFSVLVFDGALEVSSNGAAIILDEPGEGTNIADGGSPGPVTRWPQDKVQRALSTVAF
jgi:hypothetical protein